MYLARLQPGQPPQVFKLTGAIYFPKAWAFVSYRKGVCAIDYTQDEAIRRARRQLEQPRQAAVG